MTETKLGRSSVVRVAGHVLHHELEGESVLLNVENGSYYGLNETGTLIWSLLDQAKDLGAVQDRLKSDYEVDAETIWDDLTGLIGEMLDRNLVRVVGSDPSSEVAQ